MSLLSWIVRPLAYISVPVFVLKTVAAVSPSGRYYVRIGMYVCSLTFIATWGAAIAACMASIGRRFDVNVVIARSFYLLASAVMDITVEIEGAEHLTTRPAVLMLNHQSFLDILVIGPLIPPRSSIMAKSSIRYTPLGPFMILSGAIFVDRGNNARAVRSLKAAGERMKAKRTSLWMFPEGTRHLAATPDLLPFKKGGFHLAVQAGIPIIPIVCENYFWLYRKGFFGKGVLKVKVLPPVDTTGMTAADASTLAVTVRQQMLDTLREISTKTNAMFPPAADTKIPPTVSAGSTESTTEINASPKVVPSNAPPVDELVTSKRSGGSEHGTETSTEEDEGMVLVGRPA
ncbi:acyltransferase-domain-containing protein [Cylindrobasidium torrendii FP15055 ss-10]|uniref:1-acyl-sn-glycerol-3-phosphate acyltransferase n=1 Tax=Cylindrobasidium torrendii FP15055 ss-10 TaxID=1314674 RepID=A0A0D7B999_9AGAR|nr:acyltransferase-domain-containing protein [Cylindrobasidium torrendii FP15055 ss-10]